MNEATQGDGDADAHEPERALDDEVRSFVSSHGTEALHVDDLKPRDLPRVGWSGSPAHLQHVRAALDRVAEGDVDYLAVRAPNGEPVAIGGINYAAHEGAGTLWQLATKESLRGHGLGSLLIQEAEGRIKQRGLSVAMMGVEDDNPRARQLYERLGYKVCGREEESWTADDGKGNEVVHNAEIILLSKELH